MKKIIDTIFSRAELKKQPPVLIDIGASENLHPIWGKIAKYSWCIAFDADRRDFQFVEDEEGKFKKLFIFNCIVSNQDSDTAQFFLTKSPYCSSMLEPDAEKLKPFVFSDLFDIDKKETLKTKSLSFVLKELNISRVDWFKSDSQGIDLRLFKSLDINIQERVITAEFEPGIISAYKSEDKLFQILEYFHSKNFWLSDINIKGIPRIPHNVLKEYFSSNLFYKLAKESIRKAPGWGEMIFFNTFEDKDLFTIREYMLGWVFATLEKEHPFALVLAKEGAKIFGDVIFNKMVSYSISRMRMDVIKLKFFPSVFRNFKKLINRWKYTFDK